MLHAGNVKYILLPLWNKLFAKSCFDVCRTWTLIWGGILSVTMSLVPNFRHFRLLNIISLVGTAYTAVYLIATAGIYSCLPLLTEQSKKAIDYDCHTRGYCYTQRPVGLVGSREILVYRLRSRVACNGWIVQDIAYLERN